jgi:hypothetical protein
MSMKNSNDTIGNRSRDLPVCSAEPQPLRHRVPLDRYQYIGIIYSPHLQRRYISPLRLRHVIIVAIDFSENSTHINHHYMTSHSRRPFIHRRAQFRSHTPTGTWTDFSYGDIRDFGRGVDDYWSFLECNTLPTCNIYRRFGKHFIVKWQIRGFLRNLYPICTKHLTCRRTQFKGVQHVSFNVDIMHHSFLTKVEV